MTLEHQYEKGRAVPTTRAEPLIDKFMSTWNRGDIDEMLDFFADDAVYHNIPMAPAVGSRQSENCSHNFLEQWKA